MRRISGLAPLQLIGVLVLVVIGCGEPESTNGDEQPDEPAPYSQFEAHFTYPEPDRPDTSIEEELVELIEATPEGEKIRAAFYTFSRENVADALILASRRGVDVAVVLGNTNVFDDGDRWTAVDRLAEGLGEDLTICNEWEPAEQDRPTGGCMGDNIHHNKFAIFSALDDGSEHVVAQTSSNITNAQHEQFNNMVVVRDDAGLYEAFTTYWQDLHADETNLSYDRFERGDASTAAFFFPRAHGDPVMDALEQVDCSRETSIYLAVAFFTDNRTRVAEQLRDMDQQGCRVHAITRERDRVGAPGDEVIDTLSAGDIELGIFPEDADETYEVQLHSKYLAIGDIGTGDQVEPVVWTGSHNYTRYALRNNDEVLLKVRDAGLFAAFQDDWYRLQDRADVLHP